MSPHGRAARYVRAIIVVRIMRECRAPCPHPLSECRPTLRIPLRTTQRLATRARRMRATLHLHLLGACVPTKP